MPRADVAGETKGARFGAVGSNNLMTGARPVSPPCNPLKRKLAENLASVMLRHPTLMSGSHYQDLFEG